MSDPIGAIEKDTDYAKEVRKLIAIFPEHKVMLEATFSYGYMAGVLDGLQDVDDMMAKKIKRSEPQGDR